MATLSFPLPRKILADFPAQLKMARVNDRCATIWKTGRDRGRQDTFIGLINTTDWAFYLAPCFGIDRGVVTNADPALAARNIATGNFPDTTDVKSNSTSSADAAMVTIKKSVLDAAYGAGNVCYAELDPEKGFDGQSHKSLFRWVNNSTDALGIGGTIDWFKILGFAIQKDTDGYYIRFASTLNEHPGQQNGGPSFAAKQIEERLYFLGCIPRGTKMVDAPPSATREPRDLPKEWSRFVEEVLSRDLELALLSRADIQSRGEGLWSKMTRFTHLNAHGEGAVLDTGVRLV
jgi:hypothetical protein